MIWPVKSLLPRLLRGGRVYRSSAILTKIRRREFPGLFQWCSPRLKMKQYGIQRHCAQNSHERRLTLIGPTVQIFIQWKFLVVKILNQSRVKMWHHCYQNLILGFSELSRLKCKFAENTPAHDYRPSFREDENYENIYCHKWHTIDWVGILSSPVGFPENKVDYKMFLLYFIVVLKVLFKLVELFVNSPSNSDSKSELNKSWNIQTRPCERWRDDSGV